MGSLIILHEEIATDARADELDALVQVREIAAALEQLGIPATTLAIGLDLEAGLETLRARRPSCVFNLVESLGGRGELIGVVPRLLAAESIPFTGSGGDALHQTSHKVLAKRLMQTHGIATPEWFDGEGKAGNGREPWIVKSLWEHASFGLDDSSVVTGRRAAREVMARRARELGGRWFAERYVEGREFNLSILERDGDPQVLPIAEMTFAGYPAGRPKIVGYAAKWDESADEYRATQRLFPRLAPRLRDTLQQTALRCWQLFDLSGYARVDMRLDEHGTPWVLEVNANPCLSADAGFTAAAARAGIPYERLVERILEAAASAESSRLERFGQGRLGTVTVTTDAQGGQSP